MTIADALVRHHAVAEAAVVGRPHEIKGLRVVAVLAQNGREE